MFFLMLFFLIVFRNKRARKIPKNRAPVKDSKTNRRSTLAIRLFLQEFCVEFLNGAYNNIMYIVKVCKYFAIYLV